MLCFWEVNVYRIRAGMGSVRISSKLADFSIKKKKAVSGLESLNGYKARLQLSTVITVNNYRHI